MPPMSARGPIYFCYADAKGFSGQRAATELAIAGLGGRGWVVRRLPQPVFERRGVKLGALMRYAAELAQSWLRSFRLVAGGGGWLCVNLGQTRISLMRDSVPLLLGRLGLGRERVVVSLHGSLFMGWDGRSLESRLFRALMSQAGRVTVLGESQCRRLREMGLSPNRITVLLNSCDLEPADEEEIRAKHAAALKGDRPIRCLHLGSLIDTKGYPEYLEALERLAAGSGPNVQAVLCGRLARSDFSRRFAEPAQAENWIRQSIAALNTSGRVRAEWIPGAQGAAKQALFRAADIFVLPTRYAVEAQPLVLLEAMASGCAIVTTAVGEIRTLLDERSAVFLTDGSSAELAAELAGLLRDGPRRARLAAAARERFAAMFSRERHWDAWERMLAGGRATEARCA